MPFQLFKFAHGSSCSSAIANDNGLDEWELIRSDDLQELLESEPVAKTGTAGNEMDINMQKWEMVTPDEPKELLRPESSPVISNNISNEGGDPYEWEFILSDDLEDAPQNGSSVTADFAGNDANFDAREWELVPTDDNDEFMNPDISISDNVLNEKEIHVREFETVISNGLNSAKPEVLITTDHVAYEKDFDNVGHCPLGKPIPVDDIDDKAEQKPLVGIGYVLAGVEELPKMSLGAVDSVFDDGMDELLGDRPNRYWISEHRKKRDVEAENNKYPAIVLGIFGNWRTYVYKFVEKIRTFCWSGYTLPEAARWYCTETFTEVYDAWNLVDETPGIYEIQTSEDGDWELWEPIVKTPQTTGAQLVETLPKVLSYKLILPPPLDDTDSDEDQATAPLSGTT